MRPVLPLLLAALSLAGCDKLLGRALREAGGNTDDAKVAERTDLEEGADDAEAEARALERYVAYVEGVQEATQAAEAIRHTQPAEAQAQLEKLLASDAERARDTRLPLETRSWIDLTIGLIQFDRGLVFGAEQAFLRVLKASQDVEPPARLALRQYALYLLGRFAEAYDNAVERAQLPVEEGDEPLDADDDADRTELAVLAGRPDALALLAEALTRTESDAVRAVFASYTAILESAAGNHDAALQSLDRGLEHAAKVEKPEWSFVTLGKPFTGDAPWQRCASSYYEPLRTKASFARGFAPVVEGMKQLRTCLEALRPAPAPAAPVNPAAKAK